MGTGHFLNQDDAQMRAVLENARTIAVVGHSDKPDRTSYRIASYLREAGYTVIPVNPTVDSIDGEMSYASLADIPGEVDIVNVFRRSEFVADIVTEAIESGAKAVWTQLNVTDEEARERALAAGLDVAMDRCVKVDHLRLNVPVRDR